MLTQGYERPRIKKNLPEETMNPFAVAGIIIQLIGFSLFGFIAVRLLMLMGDHATFWWPYEPFILIAIAGGAKYMTSSGLKLTMEHTDDPKAKYD